MKHFKPFIILFLIIPAALNCQNICMEEIKNEIEKYGIFNQDKKGKEILTSMRSLSIGQLIILMKVGSPLVKLYSFWCYVQSDNSDYRTYFPELVTDTFKVEYYQTGCVRFGPREVGSFIFNIAENLYGTYGNSKTYPDYLDSMALELQSYEGIRGNINCRLMNIKAPENLYEKLREKAKKGDVPAIIGLSSYNKEQDIPIIKELLKPNTTSMFYGLKCVDKFPHKSFEDDILGIYYLQLNQKHPLTFHSVCKVLRKYKSPKVEEAFTELISYPVKYYFQTIILWHSFDEIKENEHPIKKRLLNKLGIKEIERRSKEYKEMNYWQTASKENRN